MREKLSGIDEIKDLIMENSTLGISFIKNRCFEWVNKRVCELLKMPMDDVLGASTRVIYPNDETYEELGKNAYELFTEREKSVNIIRLKRSDGTFFWCRFIGAALNPEKPHEGSVWMLEDITEQKIAEDALSESEKKFRSFFENSPVGVFHSVLSGRLINANKTLANILGYASSNELLESVDDVEAQIYIAPQQRRDMIQKVKENEGWVSFSDLNWNRKDGKPIVVNLTVRKVLNDNGEIDYLEGFAEDVSEKKQAEERIKYLSSVYNLILENSTIGISLVRHRVFEWVNKRVGELLKLDTEKIKGASTRVIYPSDEAYEELGRMAYPLLAKGEKSDNIIKLKKSDGTIFWCRFIGKALDPLQPQDGSIWMFEDISEKKQMEDVLRQSEEKFSKAFKNSPDLIVLATLKRGEIMDVNNNIKSIAGYERSEAIGKTIAELRFWTDFSERRKFLEEIQLNGKVSNFEINFRRKNGEIFTGLVSAELIQLNEIQYTLSIIRDISELKKNEVQLKKYAGELKELNQTKDRFFSIVAHDLKSPFLGLLGYSKLLLTDFNILGDNEKIKFITNIEKLSNNAYKLLENLLDWSRMQTGKMAFVSDKLNLFIELHSTLSLLKATAQSKNITINSEIDSAIYVEADKNMLATIVRNLVSNAIKFTNPGGIITISAVPSGRYIEIAVSDTGVGIKQENLENLFKIEKNLSTKGTANEEGTGLGLLLCKEMIEKHEGRIWVESIEGSGSTFHFTLPSADL